MIAPRIKEVQLWQWLSLYLLTTATLLLLIHPILTIGFKVDNGYNEGWNVYHTAEAMSGQLLYNGKNEWTPVNYPPLSFYIVGTFGTLLGDLLFAGRYISLISLLLISLGVGYVAKKLGGEVYDAVFASVFCLGLFVAQGRAYVGQDDPQLLAHVFVFGGFLVYIQSSKNRRLLLVALLISLGLFIKHILLPVPIAITADLLLCHRRSLFKWIGYFVLLLGSFTIITQMTCGADFLNQLSVGRGYSWERFVSVGRHFGIRLVAPLAIAIPWGVYAFFKEKRLRITSVYLLFSIVFGFFALGGEGTNVNMLFDVFVSTSIAAGMLLWYLRTTQLQIIVRMIYPWLSILLSLGIFTTTIKNVVQNKIVGYSQLKTSEGIFLEDAAFLAGRKEPVVCESLLLCFYSGKSFKYDPFLTSQMAITGKIKEEEILERLKSGDFNIIQLYHPLDAHYLKGLLYTSAPQASSDGRFTENFMRALGRYYVLVRETKDGAFYAPKNRMKKID